MWIDFIYFGSDGFGLGGILTGGGEVGCFYGGKFSFGPVDVILLRLFLALSWYAIDSLKFLYVDSIFAEGGFSSLFLISLIFGDKSELNNLIDDELIGIYCIEFHDVIYIDISFAFFVDEIIVFDIFGIYR